MLVMLSDERSSVCKHICGVLDKIEPVSILCRSSPWRPTSRSSRLTCLAQAVAAVAAEVVEAAAPAVATGTSVAVAAALTLVTGPSVVVTMAAAVSAASPLAVAVLVATFLSMTLTPSRL